MGAVDPRWAEDRVKAVMGPKPNEPLVLEPVPSPHHLYDGRLQVVIANYPRQTAEVLKGAQVPVDEGLLGLVGIDVVEGPPRGTEPHDEHVADDEGAVQVEAHISEVHLRLAAETMGLGHHHLGPRDGLVGLRQPHVAANRGLGHVGAVLLYETLPDSVCRVALFSWSGLVVSQPLLDDGPVGSHRRAGVLPRPPWRRYRRIDRLSDSPAM